jgi:LPXTG-motif cell wall-anchored protein
VTVAARRRFIVVLSATVIAMVLLGSQAFGQRAVDRVDPVPASPTQIGIPIMVENDASPMPATGGGKLPTTGQRIAVIGGLGLGLLAVGVFLIVLSQRRHRRPIGGRP